MNRDSGSNILTVRENNLALIIRIMHKAGVCTRARLSEMTGLKQATITYIINDLMRWGLVEETGTVEGKQGRRSIGIQLCHGNYRIFGVLMRKDRWRVGLFDVSGTLLKSEDVVTAGRKPRESLEMLADHLHAVMSKEKDMVCLGVGLAVRGPFNTLSGRIEMISGMPEWSNINIIDALQEKLELPVFAEHDAKCAALSEVWYGDVGEHRDILVITADNGAVGAGIITDGQLYSGKLGMSGEIGHMSIDYTGEQCECGNRGCLELYCSAARLRNLYRQELVASGTPDDLAHTHDSVDQILRAVRNGDPLARTAYRKVAVYLGLGLVNLVNILNPSLVICEGWLAAAGSYLIEVLRETLKRHLVPAMYEDLTIRLGTHMEDLHLYGANALVMEHLLTQPSMYFRPEA